jgi:TRAP-type C4-dicarboxylate transport system permease small subunit
MEDPAAMKQQKGSLWAWLDDHFEETLLIILLVAITLLTGLQVVMRKIFNNPLSWSEELCRYCFMWSGFIGVAYCIRKRCEIKIDSFISLFPARVRAIMTVMADIVCLGMYGVFLYVTIAIIGKAFGSEQISPAIGIPNYVIYFGALIGFGFAIIRLLQNMREDVLAAVKPAQPKTPTETGA